MIKPKVSVIIPCYNYEKYIEQCLMSVVLQNRNFNIEIIVGDDNSSDNSFEIAKRFRNYYESEILKFKIFKYDTNLGEINNTKNLLENSEGEYIAYLDADDYWTDPDKLKRQIEFLDNNSDYSSCITGYIELLDGTTYIPTVTFSNWLCPLDLNLDSKSLSMGNSLGSSSSRFFRNYNNLFKDYFYQFPYSDWPLNFELSLKGRIGYIDFPSYVYRNHTESLSKKNHHIIMESYDERLSILKSILELT